MATTTTTMTASTMANTAPARRVSQPIVDPQTLMLLVENPQNYPYTHSRSRSHSHSGLHPVPPPPAILNNRLSTVVLNVSITPGNAADTTKSLPPPPRVRSRAGSRASSRDSSRPPTAAGHHHPTDTKPYLDRKQSASSVEHDISNSTAMGATTYVGESDAIADEPSATIQFEQHNSSTIVHTRSTFLEPPRLELSSDLFDSSIGDENPSGGRSGGGTDWFSLTDRSFRMSGSERFGSYSGSGSGSSMPSSSGSSSFALSLPLPRELARSSTLKKTRSPRAVGTSSGLQRTNSLIGGGLFAKKDLARLSCILGEDWAKKEEKLAQDLSESEDEDDDPERPSRLPPRRRAGAMKDSSDETVTGQIAFSSLSPTFQNPFPSPFIVPEEKPATISQIFDHYVSPLSPLSPSTILAANSPVVKQPSTLPESEAIPATKEDDKQKDSNPLEQSATPLSAERPTPIRQLPTPASSLPFSAPESPKSEPISAVHRKSESNTTQSSLPNSTSTHASPKSLTTSPISPSVITLMVSSVEATEPEPEPVAVAEPAAPAPEVALPGEPVAEEENRYSSIPIPPIPASPPAPKRTTRMSIFPIKIPEDFPVYNIQRRPHIRRATREKIVAIRMLPRLPGSTSDEGPESPSMELGSLSRQTSSVKSIKGVDGNGEKAIRPLPTIPPIQPQPQNQLSPEDETDGNNGSWLGGAEKGLIEASLLEGPPVPEIPAVKGRSNDGHFLYDPFMFPRDETARMDIQQVDKRSTRASFASTAIPLTAIDMLETPATMTPAATTPASIIVPPPLPSGTSASFSFREKAKKKGIIVPRLRMPHPPSSFKKKLDIEVDGDVQSDAEEDRNVSKRSKTAADPIVPHSEPESMDESDVEPGVVTRGRRGKRTYSTTGKAPRLVDRSVPDTPHEGVKRYTGGRTPIDWEGLNALLTSAARARKSVASEKEKRSARSRSRSKSRTRKGKRKTSGNAVDTTVESRKSMGGIDEVPALPADVRKRLNSGGSAILSRPKSIVLPLALL